MKAALAVVAFVVVLAAPTSAHAAVCADYPNQAAAQKAHDTRDADGDGIYCESLPCPCLKTRDSGGGGGSPPPAPKRRASCIRPHDVLRAVFSRSKYPNIRRHFLAAVRKGWPRVMVLNRKGAPRTPRSSSGGLPDASRFDRDEYPAAVGRGKPNGDKRRLVRGINPGGWMADVAYVPSRESLARLVAGREAPRVLRRHPVQVRLHLSVTTRGHARLPGDGIAWCSHVTYSGAMAARIIASAWSRASQ
jgi:hypothetical protein